MSATMTPAVRSDDGRGPGGMWWVAWRLHRRLVIGWLLGVGVVSGLLFWVRRAYESAAATTSICPDVFSPTGQSPCPNPIFLGFFENYGIWQFVFWGLVMAPALAGLTGGVALFAVDFDRGTQVLVLSQSVSRLRWFATGLVVVGVPLVIGAGVLGSAVAGTSDLTHGFGVGWYDPFSFSASGAVAAGVCLVGLSLGLVTGLTIRSPLPAAIVALAMTLGTVAVVLAVRPHLVAQTRLVTPVGANEYADIPTTSWTRSSGLLDSRGVEVDYARCASSVEQRSFDQCLEDNDVVSKWTDFIPLEQRPQLQQTVAAVYAAIAAVLIAAGAMVLRRRRAV